jgi:cob(I)alamin adenosyltransferase
MKTVFYTKVGDGGESKIGKIKVKKNSPLFETLGSLDELNSFLGILRSQIQPKTNFAIGGKKLAEIIFELQEKIFKMQAMVAMVGFRFPVKNFNWIKMEEVQWMEKIINDIDTKLPPIKNFVIPGGSLISANLDFARALSRKAERKTVAFLKGKNMKEIAPSLAFLNRLSSLLFALARFSNFSLKIKETHPSYK